MTAQVPQEPEQYYKDIRIYADLGQHQDIVNWEVRVAKPKAQVLGFACWEGAFHDFKEN